MAKFQVGQLVKANKEYVDTMTNAYGEVYPPEFPVGVELLVVDVSLDDDPNLYPVKTVYYHEGRPVTDYFLHEELELA